MSDFLNRFHEEIIQSFYNDYKVKAVLNKYTNAPTDYKTGATSVTRSQHQIEIVALPQKLCRDFFKKTIADEYERPFLFTHRSIVPVPKDYLTFEDTRYNIKEVQKYSRYSYILVCTAHNVEAGEIDDITIVNSLTLEGEVTDD